MKRQKEKGIEKKKINIELPSVSCVQPDPCHEVVDGCVCVFVCMYVCVVVRVNEWKCWNPIGVVQILCRLPGDWLQLVCRHPGPKVCDVRTDTHCLILFVNYTIYLYRPRLILSFLLVTACLHFRYHRWILSVQHLSVTYSAVFLQVKIHLPATLKVTY